MSENSLNDCKEKQKPAKVKPVKIDNIKLNSKVTEADNVTVENAPAGKYTAIKRMLNTLDRFLTRKLGLVVGICTLAIAACSMGLLINNNMGSSAASGGGSLRGNSPSTTIDTLLWSGVALFAFLGLLSIIYVFARLRSRKIGNT